MTGSFGVIPVSEDLVQEIGLSWWSWHCFRWRDTTPLPKRNRARKSPCPPCPHPSQFQLWNTFEIIFFEQQKYRILSPSVSQWHSPSHVVSQSWNKISRLPGGKINGCLAEVNRACRCVKPQNPSSQEINCPSMVFNSSVQGISCLPFFRHTVCVFEWKSEQVVSEVSVCQKAWLNYPALAEISGHLQAELPLHW